MKHFGPTEFFEDPSILDFKFGEALTVHAGTPIYDQCKRDQLLGRISTENFTGMRFIIDGVDCTALLGNQNQPNQEAKILYFPTPNDRS